MHGFQAQNDVKVATSSCVKVRFVKVDYFVAPKLCGKKHTQNIFALDAKKVNQNCVFTIFCVLYEYPAITNIYFRNWFGFFIGKNR